MRISIKVKSNFKTQLPPQNKINRSDHTNFKIELNTYTGTSEYTNCSKLTRSKNQLSINPNDQHKNKMQFL